MEVADLHLHVLDGSRDATPEDISNIAELPRERTLLALNKSDLGRQLSLDDLPADGRAVWCSMLTGDGLDDLRGALAAKVALHDAGPPHAVISERHRDLVQSALNALNECQAMLLRGDADEPVLAAERLRGALEHLGAVTGREYTEELLDEVFSRFCVGK